MFENCRRGARERQNTRTRSLGKARRWAPCLPAPRAPPTEWKRKNPKIEAFAVVSRWTPPTRHELEQPALLTNKSWTPTLVLDTCWTPKPFTSWSPFRRFPPAQLHRKPTASSATRQDSLTESPHENPPSQPHRKPNPERDSLTEKKTLLLVSLQLRQHSLTEIRQPPGQPCRKPTCEPASTASEKAQPRKGQTHRKPTCSAVFDSAWAPFKITTIVGDAKAPAGMSRRLDKTNPEMPEFRAVLGWAVCWAQVRAAWLCTHQRAPMTSPHLISLKP